MKQPRGEGKFFGRIRSFDLACPRCDRVHQVPRSGSKVWDSRLGRFQCSECGITLALGIVAYSVGPGTASPAGDIVPTLAEAMELRKAATLEARVIPRRGIDQTVNVVKEED